MFYFSISTDIRTPLRSCGLYRARLLQSYSRGSSTLIVAGMYAPSPACLFLWNFSSAFGRTVTVGSPMTMLRKKRQTQI